MPDFTPPEDQKDLKRFIERRHPDYGGLRAHWDFLEACYEGGRDWFPENIFRYLKEGDKEFKDRLARAYRFNHSREVIDLVNKYIFKSPPTRNEDDAQESVRTFWKHSTRDGQPIDSLMRHIGTKSSIFGRVYVCVDSNNRGQVRTVDEEKKLGMRAYAYCIRPQDMLDMGFDANGTMLWCLVREPYRDDDDPFASSGDVEWRYRLWTRNSWFLFRRTRKGRQEMVELVDAGDHNLGEVPVVAVDHNKSDAIYHAPALINDIAYLDRAVANYLSNLDAIIQDQTFSQLAIPSQSMMLGDDSYDKIIEMGTKRIFTYNGEGGGKPEFLSPDPRQAQIIVVVINKIINEIYHTVGMAGERTKQDNAVGIDNSSGVAKAYDFERMNALLAAKADTLDQAENRIIRLVRKWNGDEPSIDDKDLVKYPDNFDVRGLYDEFEIAEKLALLQAPETVQRHQMGLMIDKLYPRLAEKIRTAMEAELKSWPPAPETETTPRPSLASKSRSRDDAAGQDVSAQG